MPAKNVVISQFGGFLPNGKMIGASHVPGLAEGRRYLLLLAGASVSGFWSGIVEDYAFAIESIDGSEVLVGEDGRVLKDVSLMGPQFGGEVLFEPFRFDQQRKTFPVPTRTGVTSEVASRVTAATAADAIIEAASAEGVVIAGALASSQPNWHPWNQGPFSAPSGQGGAP